MKRIVIACVAALSVIPALLMAQTPQAPPPAKGVQTRQAFEKHTVEGQPVDRRPPELDTDHPVFAGQTRAPFHKTVDVVVTTIAEGLDVPWAVQQLPSGRFLITEKAGRLRVINKDGSALHTITANMPPVYFRGQAGLLDVALDRNFAANHRIFFCYVRIVDAENSALSVDSAVLNEDAGAIASVTNIFQTAPFTNRAVSQMGSRIAIDPKDGNLFVSVGDRSTGDPLPLQAQQTDTYLGKVIHITPEGKPAPGNPSIGSLPAAWTLGHRTPQGLTFAPDGRMWEVEHGPRGGDELNL
ncbi:MAG TPA: PQQ-dependent sugar dehydrogenase, partial [Vicinamibacterales bacterium]|nr:PQQ-dependent sugar dehydrogenase [Vicinamibacterales bacterium]